MASRDVLGQCKKSFFLNRLVGHPAVWIADGLSDVTTDQGSRREVSCALRGLHDDRNIEDHGRWAGELLSLRFDGESRGNQGQQLAGASQHNLEGQCGRGGKIRTLRRDDGSQERRKLRDLDNVMWGWRIGDPLIALDVGGWSILEEVDWEIASFTVCDRGLWPTASYGGWQTGKQRAQKLAV
ncbi:hypothetical protein HYPSUDRAFT_60181 [Hypholoma sublateritium FD-334 SS-4]|uniref:Uncharacterized protein n=1 Tax=Hypholoma sublateritium (strain FD-334 SS-4) TaxID=945553 RepID=A0A0D2LQ11_HYPSF|nr:hypothetical protein HYPSUDRAFT_60181 [Hypholoma sublateritium FD-334 SS-4]